jgi:peptidoglycan/xylan/chitin deacetylase (PgdA/CDA1 family)
MPGLFMRPETLRRRFAILNKLNYLVLSLDEAITKLQNGTLPACATVITYDDGFYGNYKYGLPLHEELSLPSTIYVTTYYVQKATPIFRLVVQYMFLKTACSQLDLTELPGMAGELLDLDDVQHKQDVMWQLILHSESALDESGREALGRELGKRLRIDFDQLAQDRYFSLMNLDEIRDFHEHGVDIQLHTHRHQFLPNKECTVREIRDNRAVLEPLLEGPREHLCYPSGTFSPDQWPWLEELGIASATTCEVGLNDVRTPRYGLRRFLDMETVSELEFEAELSGFAELMRRMLRRRVRSSAPPQDHAR